MNIYCVNVMLNQVYLTQYAPEDSISNSLGLLTRTVLQLYITKVAYMGMQMLCYLDHAVLTVGATLVPIKQQNDHFHQGYLNVPLVEDFSIGFVLHARER